MTHVFDPFGDFETKGYLRNTLGEKNLQEVKSMVEHSVHENFGVMGCHIISHVNFGKQGLFVVI